MKTKNFWLMTFPAVMSIASCTATVPSFESKTDEISSVQSVNSVDSFSSEGSSLSIDNATSSSSFGSSEHKASETSSSQSEIAVESTSTDPNAPKKIFSIAFYQMYQAYGSYEYDEKRYDNTIELEEGYVVESKSELRKHISSVYRPLGDGYYLFVGFYLDEQITQMITYPFTITCSLDLFYACLG